MSRRDMQWRAAGAALLVASCGMGFLLDGSVLLLPVLALALCALPLIVHGKRVGQMLRAERRGHSHTTGVVHAARVRRRGEKAPSTGASRRT
ncbi:hypothetical protein GGR88_001469 [Sphingomonas jejuensis]|uniref:DUF2933 domain-containing protein n=1 Tax=Sphingomonas jejuensis TaxID=904715 RepID=A0ABX0XMR7_9SPHN|nr:hypothetical protein [Sphingomonas jejuensis]NJC33995.1 hypothetical protein [Sphingomonas jejuensis]